MANNSIIICTYCHTTIVDVKNDMVICNSCGAPYHKECWEEIDVCSIYGCNCENCHTIFEVNFQFEPNRPRETLVVDFDGSSNSGSSPSENLRSRTGNRRRQRGTNNSPLHNHERINSDSFNNERSNSAGFNIEGGVLYGYTGNSSIVYIPPGVTRIEEFLLDDQNDSISMIYIPRSVEYINMHASFPASLKEIDVSTYNPYFTSVEGILYDKDVTKVVMVPVSFSGRLRFPNTVYIIGTLSQYNCSFTQINYPTNIRRIEDKAFLNNKNLKNVKLGSCVEYVGHNAFAQCDNLIIVEMSRATRCERDSFPTGVRKLYID